MTEIAIRPNADARARKKIDVTESKRTGKSEKNRNEVPVLVRVEGGGRGGGGGGGGSRGGGREGGGLN